MSDIPANMQPSLLKYQTSIPPNRGLVLNKYDWSSNYDVFEQVLCANDTRQSNCENTRVKYMLHMTDY